MNHVTLDSLTLEIRKAIDIAASPEIVWQAMLEEICTGLDEVAGNAMHLRLEAWPGGRYFRDLGEGVGHLWAHVQVIKPPKLLELCGPMMMSYPAVNHVQYRITPGASGCGLTIVHRAFGLIDPEHRTGVEKGWQHEIDQIKRRAERNR